MTDLGPVAWPPEPIRTERLVLREPEARDRAAVIELLASPEVGTYIGGLRPRGELEHAMPGAPERRPGLFVRHSSFPDGDVVCRGDLTMSVDGGRAEVGSTESNRRD